MTEKYQFTKESRQIYEELPMPLAIYQQVEEKTVPLLFSDGICETTGKTREELSKMSIREIYGDVHDADLYGLADDTFSCLKFDVNMNVSFRTKLRDDENYSLMNCRCYTKELQENVKLGFFEFTEIKHNIDLASRVLDSESEGIIVIDAGDRKILYTNKAVVTMLGKDNIEKKANKCYELLNEAWLDCPNENSCGKNRTNKYCNVEGKWVNLIAEKINWGEADVITIHISEFLKGINENSYTDFNDDNLYEVTKKGNIKPIRISKSYSDMVGTEHSEHIKMINENPYADFHIEDADKLIRDISDLASKGQLKYEDILRCINRTENKYKYVRISSKLISQNDGHYLFKVNFEDVDYKYKADKNLSTAMRFTGAQYIEWDLENDEVAMDIYDEKGEMTKFKIKNSFTEESINKFIHEAYAEEYYKEIIKLKKGEINEMRIDCFCKKMGGGYQWQRHCMEVVEKDQNGKPIKVIGTYSPISEIKELETKFRIILKQYKLTTWVYYPQKSIGKMFVNSSEDSRDIIYENFPDEFIKERKIHPDDIDLIRKEYKKINEGKPNTEFAIRVCKGNAWRWINTTYTTIFDDSGEIMYAIGTSNDITEKVNIRQEYNEAYNLHKNIDYNIATATIYNVDKKEIISSIGEQNLFSVNNTKSYDDVLKMLADFALNDEDKAWIKQFNSENCHKLYGAGERSFTKEMEFDAEEGNLWFVESVKLIKNPESGDLMLFFTGEETTEKHETEAFLEFLACNSYDFSAIVDMSNEQYKYTAYFPKNERVNEFKTAHGTDFFEFAKNKLTAELDGKAVEEILTKMKPDRIINKLEKEGTFVYVYKDSKGLVEFTKKITVNYYNKKANEIGFIQQDATKEFAVEEKKNREIYQALDEVKRANSIKDEFLGRMSHDMRTPMNAIIGISDFGIEEINDDRAKIYFSQIKESSNYLLGLLNDILDMQRLEFGYAELKPEVTKILDNLNNDENIVRVRAEEKGITLKTSFYNDVDLEYIYIDSLRLNQVILNVLNNAIKYTPEGGMVSWTAEFVLTKSGYIINNTISDNGIGMSEGFLKDLYTPFVRENDTFGDLDGGVGLGLAITKNLVEIMGGTIRCTSKLNEGTTFNIILPISKPSKENIKEYKNKNNFNLTAERNLIGKRILLCEDIKINANIAAKILESFGIIVTCAENGKIALELVEVEDYDAVLMDIHMPVMDGLTAAAKIRKFNKKIPIIALSANAYKKDIDNSINAGMNSHLSKPINKQELINELCKLIK